MDQPGCLDVGGQTEYRVRKAEDAGGGGAAPPENHLDRSGHGRDFAQEQEERDGWRRGGWRRGLLPLDSVWVPDYVGLDGGAPFLTMIPNFRVVALSWAGCRLSSALQASSFPSRLARPRRPNRVHGGCPTGQPVLRTGRFRSGALHPASRRCSSGSIPHGSSPHGSGLSPLHENIWRGWMDFDECAT